MSRHSITISTLSPVHVGCDEVYEPSNFVIVDGLLHALDVADLAAELREPERKKLSALCELPDPIGALQRFFRDNAERFSGLAAHRVAVAKAIAQEYDQKAGKATQRGSAGEPVYNLFPIARTAFRTLDNAPYIPGSSLKGSVRTAWLNRVNGGKPPAGGEVRDPSRAAGRLQENRLLGYALGKFEDDPFRNVRIADAHTGEGKASAPTQVLYAVSKKKKQPREGERGSPELKVYMEAISDSLPGVFHGEFRIESPRPGVPANIPWEALCDACNNFYRQRLEAEISHAVLSGFLDESWKRMVLELLSGELGELMAARQGFLLRVGRHSGAESVTLDGLRHIKILGPIVDGKQTADFRAATTEVRFASQTKGGAGGMLPFGWLWVDACDDAHLHLAEAVRKKLAARSRALVESHRKQLQNLEEAQEKRADRLAAEQAQERETAKRAKAAAGAEAFRLKALASMTPNLRLIEEFKAAFAARAEQLRGGHEKQNGVFHSRARALAKAALEGADWSAVEKAAAADAITEWLSKVVERIDKDELKKLKLSALRTQ